MVVANGTVLPNTMLSLAVEQREDLEQRFKLLSAMRVSGGTAYNYGVGARAFVRFALYYGCTPSLPASDLTLARFIAFQSQNWGSYFGGVLRYAEKRQCVFRKSTHI